MKHGQKKSKNLLLKAAAFFIVALFLLQIFIPVGTNADVKYYEKWPEYEAANKIENVTWNHVADAMDEVLDAALEAFEGGDTKAAYDRINNAYYGYYEITGFERVAMGYIPGGRKSQMELQFSNCKSVAKKNGTFEDFKKEVETLRSMLHEDADILDGVSSNSGEDTGDTHATELFTNKYYAKWPEYEADAGLDSVTWNDVTDAMVEVLKKAKEAFSSGDLSGAYDYVNDAYYGYYEITGFERVAMGYIPGGRKSQMELQFSNCKSVAKKSGTFEEFEKEVDTLMSMLREDAHVLDGTSPEEKSSEAASNTSRSAGAATFIACFTIILREGLEAILVVAAIIAYLLKARGEKDKAKQKKMARPVYFGAILGIVASFVSALILNQLKLANSASQEIIEGVTALIAVAVLYWVSNWMISKSESEAWTSYIKSKVEKSSQRGSVIALAFTAFLAVYREGAEVILFFQPMLASGNTNMVWGGFLAGCAALVGVWLAIRLLSLRIPLKPFFIATSILMFIMAIAFLGSGIKELIEGDVITATMPAWLSWIPLGSEGIASVLDVLGVYPIVETFVPQLILLGITIIVFIWHLKRNKRLRETIETENAKPDSNASG